MLRTPGQGVEPWTSHYCNFIILSVQDHRHLTNKFKRAIILNAVILGSHNLMETGVCLGPDRTYSVGASMVREMGHLVGEIGN